MEKGFITIDFTSKGKFKRYNESVKKYILKSKKTNVLIIDYIYPLTRLKKNQYQITDHINLSGKNPLQGPQFVSLTNIYTQNKSSNKILAIGLKEGIQPNKNETRILLKAKAGAYCYNLIPTAIFAHALGFKIKAIGVVKIK